MTIKRVNSAQGQREAVKFRMSLAADFLQKEREKLHPENLTFTISMRYLLLGRKLLLGKEDVPTDQEICEIDLTNMFRHTDMLKDAAKENEESTDLMQTSPFHLYSEVRVCERCYAVYNLIRKACMKEFAINSQRQKSATPKRRRLTTADTRSISPSSTLGVKDNPGCYISPLGKMHKYSLNDMLADIGHQQAELDNEEAPNALKAKLLEMYKGMTLEEGKRLEEERKIEALRKRPLLDTKLRDPGSVEEMGRRLFPTGSRNALNVLPSSEKNLTKWRSFLNKRRQKSKHSC